METQTPYQTMSAICERFEGLMEGMGQPMRLQRIDRMIDLEKAWQEFGLDLDALLAADSGNFLHDVAGIHRHMDRTTGKMGDCFVPRFSRS